MFGRLLQQPTSRHGMLLAQRACMRTVHTTHFVCGKSVTGVANEARPNFDPTLPGRMPSPWSRFTGYMSFYKEGLKELWANRSAYRDVKRRAARGEQITRAEYQILTRYPSDRLRILPFGVLVILAPELIYLIVLFMPGFCPSTCVTYKTVAKTAAKHDALKQKLHVRMLEGLREDGLSVSDFVTEHALAKAVARGSRLFSMDRLGRADLLMLYRFLGIGGMGWILPTSWLRAGVARHLSYVRTDDSLLLKEQAVGQLELVDLFRACQERGIPSADLPDYQLRQALYGWAQLTQKQAGAGNILPIAWSRLVLLNRSTQVVLGLCACSHWVAAGLAADGQLKVPLSEMQISGVEISGAQAENVEAERADSAALGSATQPTGLPDAEQAAEQTAADSEADEDPTDSQAPPDAEQAGEEAQFTGLQPSEMFRWIRDEAGREDNPDDQAVTADQDDLDREAENLRTAEFVSDIVAALESAM
ncbi:hypothetical protein EV183_003673 [Coemansia sp. RSA 2336]|nr:hypothetical protein EV183_003673 [Coemansia sp. RSA 2336]